MRERKVLNIESKASYNSRKWTEANRDAVRMGSLLRICADYGKLLRKVHLDSLKLSGLRYVPPDLTYKNSVFCPQNVFAFRMVLKINRISRLVHVAEK